MRRGCSAASLCDPLRRLRRGRATFDFTVYLGEDILSPVGCAGSSDSALLSRPSPSSPQPVGAMTAAPAERSAEPSGAISRHQPFRRSARVADRDDGAHALVSPDPGARPADHATVSPSLQWRQTIANLRGIGVGYPKPRSARLARVVRARWDLAGHHLSIRLGPQEPERCEAGRTDRAARRPRPQPDGDRWGRSDDGQRHANRGGFDSASHSRAGRRRAVLGTARVGSLAADGGRVSACAGDSDRRRRPIGPAIASPWSRPTAARHRREPGGSLLFAQSIGGGRATSS